MADDTMRRAITDIGVGRTFTLGVAVVGFFVLLMLSGQLFETVDADMIMVVQHPVNGSLTWYSNPGIKWQGFGKVTLYPKRSQYPFSIPIRFNDGGHGTLKGSIQYEMPVDENNLTALHVRFGNSMAIQKQLIETITNKSVYMTGPLMSSKESYAEKRNYLISYVEDQISRGVYKTIQRETKTKDPMTGADKTVTIVEVSLKDGIPERQEEAVLAEFGIKVFNFAIDELSYEQNVEKQIQQQQQIAMEVQTAIANAKRAEQAAITAEKDGQAAVMKAKYEKEVEKIKEVTLAQQRLEVASLDARAAEQKKRELILLGEGEGARKRLIMEADGALEKKLDAFIKVNELYAEAVKGYQGSLVPTVVMGENNGRQPAGGGVAELMQLFTAMAAKNLALDMGVTGASRTKK
jgi:hypothetical protein